MATKKAVKKATQAKKGDTKDTDKPKGRQLSEKSLWIMEQLKAGKTVSTIVKEGTEKFGSKVYGPMVYRLRKKLQEAGDLPTKKD